MCYTVKMTGRTHDLAAFTLLNFVLGSYPDPSWTGGVFTDNDRKKFLELGGYDLPTTMQGTSLVAGLPLGAAEAPAVSPDAEAIIRERLRGLGYIS